MPTRRRSARLSRVYEMGQVKVRPRHRRRWRHLAWGHTHSATEVPRCSKPWHGGPGGQQCFAFSGFWWRYRSRETM